MIRSAGPEDAAAIAQIWNAVIRDSTATFTDVEKTEAQIVGLIETRPVFVARADQDVLGFGTYGEFRAGPGYRHTAEHSLYVRPSAQGRGVGRELLSQIISHARANGITTLVAGISGDNVGALDFHKKQGFAQVGFLSGVGFKFAAPQDLVLMQKAL